MSKNKEEKKSHKKNFAYTSKTEVMTSKMGQFEQFLENPGSGVYSVHCASFQTILQCTLYNVQCTMYIVKY